ncbi:hypothetical protein O181_020132 [Austropuccinia psidii MF-1]|uniref:Integrase zinc-binding domain-containing protein n=1 Tax=Austropuccinia psidii MF-1 TaxID=1389203 RepID=A0A9Q3GV22_9BASI|nr:hypothetical protein [Austropuccinia psidii MF-1]
MGHRGKNKTYRRIKERCWWEGMKSSVKIWVQSCLAFQKRIQNLKRAQGKSKETSTLFERVSMDAVHIKYGRWKYMVVARDGFSGWPETVGRFKLKAKEVADWFTLEWIYRYGSPKELNVDGVRVWKRIEICSKKSRIKDQSHHSLLPRVSRNG